MDLRLVMLAVPPVIPAVHRDLRLDETLVGALNGLPVALLAVAAVPGSLMVARLGARRALVGGLLLVAGSSAARGIGPSLAVIFATTLVMGAGVAVSQPALPSMVKDWFPVEIGLATAVYANGLLVGEIIPTALTAPLVLPLVHQSWELAFGFWALPVLLTAGLILLLTPHETGAADAPPRRWWPDWRSRRTYQVGLIFGCISALYWGSNAFLPEYLHATHRAGLTTAALAALNGAQMPTSILVALFPHHLVGRRWPLVLSGAAMVCGIAGLVYMPGGWAVFWAAWLGIVSGLVFVLSLALPPLLAGPEDVARLSAAMFTITYTCSFLSPVIGGKAWDLTGLPATAFLPAAVAGFAMVALALRLRLPRS